MPAFLELQTLPTTCIQPVNPLDKVQGLFSSQQRNLVLEKHKPVGKNLKSDTAQVCYSGREANRTAEQAAPSLSPLLGAAQERTHRHGFQIFLP